MDMEFWQTVGASAFLGACVAGLWGIIKDICNRCAEKKALQNSLIAEVKSLNDLMKERGYISGLENILIEMENQNLEYFEFSIVTGDNFSPIYRANAHKIGVLDNNIASNIIKYHACLYAVTCDLHEKSLSTTQGFDKETIKQMIELLKMANNLAKKIISKE